LQTQQGLSEIVPELVQVNDEIESILQKGVKNHLGSSQPFFIDKRGKKLRPALFLSSAKIHWQELTELIPLAASLELIHLATLVHDDVVDNATLRRNMPTVNATKGNKIAVLMGDYFFSKAFSLLTTVGNMEIINLLSRVVEEMSLGEIQQQIDAFNADLTEEEYLQRIRQKTAQFMASCCLAGCLTSEAPEDLKVTLYNYGLNLGMAFQIVDDVMDFKSDEFQTGKNNYSDLRNGVITLPLIYVLRTSPKSGLLRKSIQDKGPKTIEIERLLEEVEIDKGLAYALNVADQHIEKAGFFAGQVPSKPVMETFQAITHLIFNRAKQ